jgi:hypothetical protein
MIDFNENDINMNQIKERGGFSSLKTKLEFRVFGLAQDDNPPIGINYNMDKRPSNQIEDEITNFFRNNGLELAFDHKDDEKIHIGLRRDVRENVDLSVALLKTIILNLDGGLELDNSFKIPGLNKFVTTETNS